MKIIFLDIDGVLNHHLWYAERGLNNGLTKEEHDISEFSPFSISILNDLTDITGAKIVVSSSWRKTRTVDELKALFVKVGITGEVIDKTPMLNFVGIGNYHYSVPRGCEIKAWLEMNKDIIGDKITKVKYVILDDDSDMLYWQRNNYLWVDPYCGLTPGILFKAKQILLS